MKWSLAQRKACQWSIWAGIVSDAATIPAQITVRDAGARRSGFSGIVGGVPRFAPAEVGVIVADVNQLLFCIERR
jgi:hypothetical protein